MTTLREAAQQALEALVSENSLSAVAMQQRMDAIKTLKAALAEPVQEPVAWRFHDGKMWCYVNHIADLGSFKKFEPLYNAPPQRKPLTEEEISNIWDGHVVPVFGKNGINPIVFARAIEAKHGIGGQQ